MKYINIKEKEKNKKDFRRLDKTLMAIIIEILVWTFNLITYVVYFKF